MSLKKINVSVVLASDESWYDYKFGQTKKNFFSNRKYSYCFYQRHPPPDDHILRKLEIYGKKFNIKFDHLENNYKTSKILISINLYRRNKFQKKFLDSNKKKILVITETDAIDPYSYQIKLHKKFDTIFTRKYTFLKKKNKKYKFYNGNALVLKENKKIIRNKKKNFLCIFMKNRYWHHKRSLSYLRYNIIEWFNKKYPNDLDLYGYDWDKNFIYIHKFFKKNKIFRNIFLKILSMSLIKNFFSKKLEVYKGAVKDKINTLSQYKFEICIENSILHGNGSTNERIFHSLLSGTVPIFVGHKKKFNFIPSNCYIDFWKFKNMEDLYDYIKNMSESDYKKYLKNAERYVKSKEFFKNTVDFNALNIINEINYLSKQ